MGSSTDTKSTTRSNDYSSSFNKTWTQSLGQNAFGVLGDVGAGSSLSNAVDSNNITGSFNSNEQTSLGASSPIGGNEQTAEKGSGAASLLGGNILSYLPWVALVAIGFLLIRSRK